MRQFGIDAIGVYVPRLFVDLTGEWANVRAAELGEPSVEQLIGKVTTGVGVRQMAVPDAHEDSATMAAMAAIKAIDEAGIDPRDIDFLAIGTETTVDQSKSIGAYVLGMLEQRYGVALPAVQAPQFQFACIGATFALAAALNHLRAGQQRKPYALVIATDISRYSLRSAGEYTQGAGAVALLVKEDPRLLVLDSDLMSVVTRDERDFFRPNGSQTAVVDGKYSIGVYLDCIEAAWHEWLRRSAALQPAAPSTPSDLDFLLFHVPFPRMAEYAAARILGDIWVNDAEQRERLATELPPLGSRLDAQQRTKWERQLAQTSLFKQFFAAKVEPSLTLSRSVGNIYSGSLYLALASLFSGATHADNHLAGRRIGLFSYGSGASAAVLSGCVAARYREVRWDIRAELAPRAEGGRRVELSLAQYERLHDHRETTLAIAPDVQAKLDVGAPLSAADSRHLATVLATRQLQVQQPPPSVVPPCNEFALVRLGTEIGPSRTDWGYRYYKWIPG